MINTKLLWFPLWAAGILESGQNVARPVAWACSTDRSCVARFMPTAPSMSTQAAADTWSALKLPVPASWRSAVSGRSVLSGPLWVAPLIPDTEVEVVSYTLHPPALTSRWNCCVTLISMCFCISSFDMYFNLMKRSLFLVHWCTKCWSLCSCTNLKKQPGLLKLWAFLHYAVLTMWCVFVCVCSAPCPVGWVRGHERYAVSATWATLFLMRSATWICGLSI